MITLLISPVFLPAFSDGPDLYTLSHDTPITVIVIRLEDVKAVYVLLNQRFQLSLLEDVVIPARIFMTLNYPLIRIKNKIK